MRSGIAVPRITCAICCKEVDRVTAWEDSYERLISVKAWCHGDTDVMQMTSDQLHSLGKPGIDAMMRDGGVAFATKRIAGGECELKRAAQ